LGQTEASIRVWTAKEAAAKALCMNLAQSWQQVAVKHIGPQRSVLEINGRPHNAFHDTIENHLFTLVGSE
jgi:phosphopantetheinyl transferase (holo-ACP synthase)